MSVHFSLNPSDLIYTIEMIIRKDKFVNIIKYVLNWCGFMFESARNSNLKLHYFILSLKTN